MGFPRPVTVTGVSGAEFGPRGHGYSRPTPKKVWRQFAADDYAGGFIRFDDGAGGQQAGGHRAGLQIESFWASHQPPEGQIEVFGTAAGARLNPLTLFQTHNGVEEDVAVSLPRRGQPESWAAIAAHFIECILDGVECTAPLRHGLQVQQMLEALLSSAARGREVRIRNYYDKAT
jgi:predicted dehydrogenase